MQQKQIVRLVLALLAVFMLIYLTHESWWYIREHSYDEQIRAAAAKYGVDPFLVKAVAWRESKFKRLSVGKAGEIGLMQVTLSAAKEWAEAHKRPPPSRKELFNATTNLEAGTWYLGRALQRWRGKDDPVPFALAEYNAGRSNVLKWIEKAGESARAKEFIAHIGFASTKRYVQDVMAIQKKLERRGKL